MTSSNDGFSIKPSNSFNTVLPADSVEWCPIDGEEKLLICGTYQLQETTATNRKSFRRGCIYLLRHEDDGDDLKVCCSENTSGILDLKWSEARRDETCIFGAAKSDGVLSLYSVSDERVASVEEATVEDDGLALSLDWSSGPGNCIAVSTSVGNIAVLDGVDCLAPKAKWRAHDLEAWICAFDSSNADLIYSGADDCKLKAWDLRTDNSKPLFAIKHSMGITSLQSNPHKPHCLASGSYDEEISIWDTRNVKQRLRSACVGGGVWRVKWEPLEGLVLAAACMSNGVQLVDFFTGDEPTVLASFADHDSLLYGVDWNRTRRSPDDARDGRRTYTLASCSFYDSNLKVWQWNSC